jgi:hypothetical protein
MKVLRHEEHDGACELASNGGFETRWSKTMIGYESEDLAYALEVTYNYGVDAYEYEAGSGLRRFVLIAPPALYKKAKKLVQR